MMCGVYVFKLERPGECTVSSVKRVISIELLNILTACLFATVSHLMNCRSTLAVECEFSGVAK